MKKIIKQFLYGKAASGVPVSAIKTSTHTVLPAEVVPIGKMHLVIWETLQQVQREINHR